MSEEQGGYMNPISGTPIRYTMGDLRAMRSEHVVKAGDIGEYIGPHTEQDWHMTAVEVDGLRLLVPAKLEMFEAAPPNATTGTGATYTIDGRTITVERSTRITGHWPSQGERVWDVVEGDELLTTADPWVTSAAAPPTMEEVRRYLHPRRQVLQRLMTKYRIVLSSDYEHLDEYEILFDGADVGHYVAVTRDETYNFFHVVDTLDDACRSLASQLGEDTGGSIVGIYDLKDGSLIRVQDHVLVWPREPEQDVIGHYGPASELDRARKVVALAERELEAAVLAVVSQKVKAVYPTAASLMAEGQYNEVGLLHLYTRRILDADGRILDSQADPSDAWDELTDKVDQVLWEISERFNEYDGEHIIDLT